MPRGNLSYLQALAWSSWTSHATPNNLSCSPSVCAVSAVLRCITLYHLFAAARAIKGIVDRKWPRGVVADKNEKQTTGMR